MSQLLIIDVQTTYAAHIPSRILRDLPEYASNYSEILYLWDNISGQDFYEEVPEEWLLPENEDFYGRLRSFTKNYAFFRGFMDSGVSDDDIVALGKFMLANNLYDGTEISDDEEILSQYNERFKTASFYGTSFDDYIFYIPEDLICEIQDRIKNGVTVVGGGLNECLKEVCLLLSILDIEYNVDNSFTY